MKFKYVGPFDAVDLDGHGVVEHGHQVEVTGAAAESLDAQTDWQRVDKPQSRKKSEQATPPAEKNEE